VVLLKLFAVLTGLHHQFDWAVRPFLGCFGSALHTKEDHLFLAHLLDLLTSEDTSNAALDELSCNLFLLLVSSFGHLTFTDLTLGLVRDNLGKVLLEDLLDTETALATTLVLLDPADGRNDFHVKGEGVMDDFLHWYGTLVVRA